MDRSACCLLCIAKSKTHPQTDQLVCPLIPFEIARFGVRKYDTNYPKSCSHVGQFVITFSSVNRRIFVLFQTEPLMKGTDEEFAARTDKM